MRPSSCLGLLLVGCTDVVLGGSRLWEAYAPNPRTNPDPVYSVDPASASTSALAKRATSIKGAFGTDMRRPWPQKKIRYYIEETNEPLRTRVRGLFDLAKQLWAELEQNHGFQYEEVDMQTYDDNNAFVLLVQYNSVGILATSLGMPPSDDESEGPTMVISDMEGVGQDDVQANVAHELGHAWGLIHGHQNRRWWQKSDEHWGNNDFGGEFTPQEIHFETNKFNCENLKDYEDALERANKLEEKMANTKEAIHYKNEAVRMCRSQYVAERNQFTASQWLPFGGSTAFTSDDTFDPDSLMLYPSGAGGKGLGDDRLVVMRYSNGELIRNRIRPTPMDIQRLVNLYGSEATPAPDPIQKTAKGGRFSRLRTKFSRLNLRAGHSKQGMC